MSNADNFLQQFTAAEKWLRDATGMDRSASFYWRGGVPCCGGIVLDGRAHIWDCRVCGRSWRLKSANQLAEMIKNW